MRNFIIGLLAASLMSSVAIAENRVTAEVVTQKFIEEAQKNAPQILGDEKALIDVGKAVLNIQRTMNVSEFCKSNDARSVLLSLVSDGTIDWVITRFPATMVSAHEFYIDEMNDQGKPKWCALNIAKLYKETSL